MVNEKLIIFSKRLQNEHVISFRLYNASYKVTLSHQKISIHQEGLNISYTYSSLKELFYQYVVYGSPLIDNIEDIKIC